MGARNNKKKGRKGNKKKTQEHCCYLLTSTKPQYKDHTYIGYTVDPPRRLRQHNREISQGAAKTEKKGPWRNVVFVSGFPNKACGLQFEWVWQNPLKSRRTTLLKETKPVSRFNQYRLPGKVRYLFEILQFSPWSRYPLTVNWVGERDKALETAIKKSPDFPPNISQRFLKTLSEFGDGGEDSDEGEDNDGEEEEDMGDKGKEKEEEEEEELAEEDKTVDWEGITYLEDDKPDQTDCVICHKTLNSERRTTTCPHKHCKAPAHLICLSSVFLEQEKENRKKQHLPAVDHLVPNAGKCPSCYSQTTWGEVLGGNVV